MAAITRICSIGALAVALAVPANARTIDSWEVNVASDARSCTMVSTFADNVSIGLVWAPRTGELGFLATVPHPNALGGKATAPIAITFDGSGQYTQWEDETAKVVGGLDGDAVVANWGAGHAEDLASAVRAASHVTVRVADRELGTYDLSGSPAAYRELTQCGKQIASR